MPTAEAAGKGTVAPTTRGTTATTQMTSTEQAWRSPRLQRQPSRGGRQQRPSRRQATAQ